MKALSTSQATTSFSAVVIGGSLGGLAAAHELASAGAEIAVHERSVDRTQPRGAGIVMQPEVASLLARVGRSVPSVSVALSQRQQLHRHGTPSRYQAPQWMTAWDTVYDALRQPLEGVCVRFDSRLDHLRLDGDSVTAVFGGGFSHSADFLVGADGVGSATRLLTSGRDDGDYAGYVAFRGLEPESELPEALVDLLAKRFTSFGVSGMQMLCYLVPGVHGETDPGNRRVNWVWYVNTSKAAVAGLMVGRSGQKYAHFLPPGELRPEPEDALLSLADEALPGPFAELVRLSTVFMQPVFDLPPTRMAADRVALIGDAAGTVRPHTASGTSKALGDAASLARALNGWNGSDPVPRRSLHAWELSRLTHLTDVAAAGVRLAARSSLGAGGPRFLEAGERVSVRRGSYQLLGE
ncbi:MAG: FAD-dependent monooxygenase [Mycobacterium sp.]